MSSKLLDRVVFYSKEDMTVPHHLKKVEELLNNFDTSKLTDINDLLELQHIKRYFDEELFLRTWDEPIKNDFTQKIDQGTTGLKQFFLAVKDDNLSDFAEAVEFPYRAAFWKSFSFFKVFDRISKTSFLQVLENHPHHLRDVLSNFQTVTYYDSEIRSFMLAYDKSAELLLAKFEEGGRSKEVTYMFPKSLTLSDKENIISKSKRLPSVTKPILPPILKLRMTLTTYNDTAIHEAGHGIMAYLAPETFVLEFLTADPYLSRQQNARSLGGLKGHLLKDGDTLTFQERDTMILMCHAGMAADDINHCECKPTEQLYDNAIYAKKMNSNKYSGDLRLMLPHLQQIVPLLKVEQRTYTKSCQKLLHELFTTDAIKTILLDLRNELANAPRQTLTGDQIKSFLDNTALKNWKSEEGPKIVESRLAALQSRSKPSSRFSIYLF